MAKKIEIAVYIEGQYLPGVSQVVRHVGKDMISTCEIFVFPTPLLRNLIPGSMISIYYNIDGVWKRFFSGELIGHTFAKQKDNYQYIISGRGYGAMIEKLRSKYVSLNPADPNIGYSDQAFLGLNPDPSASLKIFKTIVDKGVSRGFYEVMTKMKDFNRLLARTYDTVKYSKRVSYIDNEQSHKILKYEHFIEFLLKSFISFSPNATLLDVMKKLFPLVMYDFVEIQSPFFSGGKIAEFIIKPNLYFAAPPTHNLMFGTEVGSYTFPINYAAEPTRLMMGAQVRLLNAQDFRWSRSLRFFAPKKVGEAVKYLYEGDYNTYNSKPLTDVFTKEELLRGVIPSTVWSPYTENILSIAEKESYEGISQVQQNYAYYVYYLQRLQSRQVNVTMEFNQNLTPGFPAAIIDKNAIIVGELYKTIDTISINGTASTTAIMMYSRYIDEENKPYENVFGDDNDELAPQFFDDAFRDENIHSIYEELFGTTSVTKYSGRSDSASALQKIANEFYSFSTKKKMVRYAEKITRREIITEGEEMIKLLGAEKTAKIQRKDKNGKLVEIDDKFYHLRRWGGTYSFDEEDVTVPFMKERQSKAIDLYKIIVGYGHGTRL